MATPIPVPDDPMELFEQWFAAARALDLPYADAMSLATVDVTGQPHVRTVLLKGYDARGFVFYTNFTGPKARQLLTNPRAALCFYWQSLGQQIRITGSAVVVDPADADAYFASRPRTSRIGAWASDQSEVISGREVLEARVRELESRYEGREVPRPPHWSGFRIVPDMIEFWQEGVFRLHDRLLYRRVSDGWQTCCLAP